MSQWTGRKVLIIGAARQGTALARYLARSGAIVTLNDQKEAPALLSVAKKMEAIGVKCVFGSHPLALLEGVDVVSISGGIPLTHPLIAEAYRKDLPLTNDTQVFLEEVPCPVIGITGSAGKTTTTTLVGRILEQSFKKSQRVWVGGNIGVPLVDKLGSIQPKDTVVLEISSFQLEQMTRSPHIAAILNVTPNHLDRHGSFDSYRQVKSRLISFQQKGDFAVLNRDDPATWDLRQATESSVISFGLTLTENLEEGSFIQNGSIQMKHAGSQVDLLPLTAIKLKGQHNVSNVMAACTISFLAGASSSAMENAVKTFNGVAHRLEFVRELRGARWYNDSIATTPERSMAAISSFGEPIILLLGGRDKNLPWENLVALIRQRVDHVIVFGEAAPKILTALGKTLSGQKPYSVFSAIALQDAIHAAAEIAQPGSVILFSPGGTSFDEFKDFEERGENFRKWVNQLR